MSFWTRGLRSLALGSLIPAVLAAVALGQGSGGVGVVGGGVQTEPPQGSEPPPDSISLHQARVRPKRALFDGVRPLRLEYELRGRGEVDLRFDFVRRPTGDIETTLYRENVEAGLPQSLEWNGLDSAGRASRGGLRVEITGVDGERIRKSGPEAVATNFNLYDHAFPVPGRHSYGDGLGAGRNHGGQDIAAACGKRLVAARGGRVRYSEYQAQGAGYYLVIDGKSNKLDYVYMHMKGPAKVDEGERVKTGQLVGRVGSTGRSTGCHLHFELWRGPWFDGGERTDPAPALQRWDRYS